MKHTLVALVENQPGVLMRVANLFARRGFNIESFTVGHTETTKLSRMTVVVDGAQTQVEQVIKQLYKLIDVLKVSDVTEDRTIDRELALIKVTASNSASRAEVVQFVNIFRGKIVDVAPDSLIVEVTGTEEKVDSLLDVLRPFGIKEMVRTGTVAMTRGGSVSARLAEDRLEAAG
ncbi:MAG: acetolactate synthase small subunit [Chloroflexi bacterium]|nr:acetolactate synthase small subunit [Chloroflexota bacterium]